MEKQVQSEVAALRQEVARTRRQLSAVYASESWKVGQAVTAPLRLAKRIARGRTQQRERSAATSQGATPLGTAPMRQPSGGGSSAAALYLDLLKQVLVRLDLGEPDVLYAPPQDTELGRRWAEIESALPEGAALIRRKAFDPAARLEGRDWPAHADTMIGLRRLDNLQASVETVIAERIPGDLIETGVWRGGATILMRAVLAAYGVTDRTVWVADSFEGLPRPEVRGYEQDHGDRHWTRTELAVTREEVEANFARYGLLDEQVRFLEGWFHETLPDAPIERLAVLRLDGDMYGSTMDALDALYDKVSVGGFVIVDDYGAVKACRRAIEDFREARKIDDPIHKVDWTGAYWRRSS